VSAVRSRFQLIVSRKLATDEPGGARSGALRRVKRLFGALLLAAVVVGVFVVALVLGAIVAAVVWIALVVVAIGLILKAAIQYPEG
jgi:Flp pilus assembly protein TadB